MHEERTLDSFPAGLVPHSVAIHSVAQKDIALQRDPLASVIEFMCGEPGLLGIAMANCSSGWMSVMVVLKYRFITDYAKIPSCTLPAVSVRRKSRPEYR